MVKLSTANLHVDIEDIRPEATRFLQSCMEENNLSVMAKKKKQPKSKTDNYGLRQNADAA